MWVGMLGVCRLEGYRLVMCTYMIFKDTTNIYIIRCEGNISSCHPHPSQAIVFLSVCVCVCVHVCMCVCVCVGERGQVQIVIMLWRGRANEGFSSSTERQHCSSSGP